MIRRTAARALPAVAVALSLVQVVGAAALAPFDLRVVAGRDEALSAPTAALMAWGGGAIVAVALGVVVALRPTVRALTRRLTAVGLALVVIGTGARVAVAAAADVVDANATGAVVTVVRPAGGECVLVAVERVVSQGYGRAASEGRLYIARGGPVAVPIASWQADGVAQPFADHTVTVQRRGGRLALRLDPDDGTAVAPDVIDLSC